MADLNTDWIRTQVKAAQTGDDGAFTNLVEAFKTPVYNLCFRMLGTPQEAEDASQECFWRVYQALKKFDNQRSFATWILSITAHYCIDQIRKRHMNLIPIDLIPEEPAPILSPEGKLAQHEDQLMLRALLDHLNPTDRATIVLKYWYDFSEDEIAKALSLSTSAVKSRLHRARLELATQWQIKAQESKSTVTAKTKIAQLTPSLAESKQKEVL